MIFLLCRARPTREFAAGSNSIIRSDEMGDERTMRPDSLVDGEGLGLEHNEVGGLGGFEVLEDEASLGHRASVLLTLVFGEEGHLGGSFLIFLGDPGEDRATQAGVASRSLPASIISKEKRRKERGN